MNMTTQLSKNSYQRPMGLYGHYLHLPEGTLVGTDVIIDAAEPVGVGK